MTFLTWKFGIFRKVTFTMLEGLEKVAKNNTLPGLEKVVEKSGAL